MTTFRFRQMKLSQANKQKLQVVNGIIKEYQEQGYKLTLRQLYYQLVSRDIVPNKQAEYSKLSVLLKEGRMGGIVDWDAIEDRLRVPSKPASFSSPENLMDAAINQYMLPHQDGQPIYIEVWVEKDALSSVLKRVTQPYHIPILVNRGYSSVSAMYDAFMRFVTQKRYENRSSIIILYLGDYDPSGLDMIRDIENRIVELKIGYDIDDLLFGIVPIALTREQIEEHDPPPNPAKMSDPRAGKFVLEHGNASWEVDALRPEVLHGVLDEAILHYMNKDIYDDILKREVEDKDKLKSLKKYL